ncbi:MAG: protease inhibitor I42 family protein [Actinobacteria bacterium]|nr:protease inhibitor I42 family protein [Actinomycetota bacterium]
MSIKMKKGHLFKTGCKNKQQLFWLMPQALSIFLAAALIISIFAFAGCASSTAALTEKDNGKSIELKVGETITVKLESNPTTGYSWSLSEETDQGIMFMISSEYKQSSDDKELVGGGGFETFKFKAAGQGSTEIILNYMSPWEEDIKPEDIFRLSINVK